MNSSSSAINDLPIHVPVHLLWEHNLDVFPQQFEDPYVGACDAIHEGPDIVWAAKGAYCGQPGWMLTRFALIEEVFLDTTRFSAALNRDGTAMLGFELPLIPGESDPPNHSGYRQLLQSWFNPKAIRTLEPMLKEICDDLIGKFETRGRCEFVGEFSSLLPSYVFLGLMGLPRELLSQFLGWENDFLRGETMKIRIGAIRAIYEYFKICLTERRENPRADLVSHIANGQIARRSITEDEAVGTCITLFLGGLDSVTSGLGWYLRHIARDHVLQDFLRANPERIPAAVDELSRAYATNTNKRIVTEDIMFHDIQMLKGDIVALPTFLGARDARQYERPHVIDLDRRARSMTFGTGIHNCLGINLAKREIILVISEFLSRFRNITITPGENEHWTTQTIWGVKRLPLSWE